MAKYKKRPDGRYETTITVNVGGKAKKKHVYGKTIKAVDDKIAELRTQDMRGISALDRNITIAEWARLWLETYKKPSVAYNTYKGYKIAVNDHIIPQIGDMRLSDVKPNDLQAMINTLSDKTPTARKVKISLNGIFSTALRNDYIHSDPSVGLTLSPHKPKEKRALTENEIRAILTADLSPKERAFVDVLYYTGVRKEEALALTVKDINFLNKTIVINKALIFPVNQPILKEPKTDAGQRTLPMPDKLVPSLKAVCSDGIIFRKETDNGYMSDTAFRRMWKHIREKCSEAYGRELAPDVTPHIFRHNYASMLYKHDVDIKTAQALLGHKSLQMTLSIYTHLSKHDTTKRFEVVNKIF